MTVRLLTLGDVEAYVHHMIRADADSGAGGVHFTPYGRDETVDVPGAIARERHRWSTPLEVPGWRRAWGWFRADTLVGHAYLAGGHLRSELHRASLGMGLEHGHRRQGGGRALLEAALAWARAEEALVWVDLGVFAANLPAQALYRRAGFVERGRTPDRFRVDGVSIDDISMSLSVG